MKNRFFVLTVLALTLAACNDDKNEILDNDGPVAAEFTAAIGNNMTTRVSGTDGDQWDNGDCIGITGAGYTNIPYVINNNRFAPQSTVIYLNGPDTKTFNAYYPYNEAGGVLTATTDATAQQEQPAIDFLFATGATGSTRNPTVEFTGGHSFHHCMSRITLAFEAGDGVDFSQTKPEGYTLGGAKLDGTFDTGTGTAAANDGAQAGELSMKLENGILTSSVIVFPQTAASLPLVVKYNNVEYKATLTVPEGALKAGGNYIYTVKVNATGLMLEGCTIGDWTDDGEEIGGVAENLGYTYDDATHTYNVHNADGLLAWNEAARNDLTLNCILTADITLPAVPDKESNWTPVGTDNNNSYTGTFDGGDHTIRGLAVYRPGMDYAGMFGTVNKNGAVQNLTLMDVKITGGINVGGVAGYSNEGTVTGCSTSGNVSGNTNVGGVVGQNNSGNISGCNTAGNVSGTTAGNSFYVGGVAGYNNGGNVSGCSAAANVSGNYYVGGVAGWNNKGNISGCSAAGNVSGNYYIGGVVGQNNSGNVTACYHGTSTVTGTGSSAGGVVGTNENGTVTGTVTGTVAGGVAGWNNKGNISGCSAAGNVSGNYYIGGVVGQNNSGNVTACYHGTSTVTGTGSSAGGVVGTNENGTVTGTVTGTVAGGVAGGNDGTLTACYWNNSLDAGVGSGSGETTKVDGTAVTWETAQSGMNEAIGTWNNNNPDKQCGWHYVGATETDPPTLAETPNP